MPTARHPAASRTTWIAIALLAPCLLALLPPPARAEIGACNVIDTLPTTILVPGRYCLEHDIVGTYVEGYALRIYADNVVLDCMDHRLVETNANNTVAAIYVTGDHKAATIRNCVVDGFQTGILVQESGDDGSSDHVIENNSILRSRQVGITVSGSNIRIEGNRVLGNTGNLNGVAYGIRVYSSYGKGVGNTIRGNTIADFRFVPPPGTGSSVTAISFFQVRETEVVGNTISGIYAPTSQFVYGINSSNATGSVVADNHVLAPPPLAAPYDGLQYSAIRLDGTVDEQATNLCRGNVVGHFSINIIGCTQVDNTSF